MLTTDSQDASLNFKVHQDGKAGRLRPASAAEATVLSSITNAEFPHLFALREEMRTWRLLQLDPALLRRPVPVTADDLLTPDGANLAAVLARLKAETLTAERPMGALSDIAAELNALIPGNMSRSWRWKRHFLPRGPLGDGPVRLQRRFSTRWASRWRWTVCVHCRLSEPWNLASRPHCSACKS